MNIPKAALFLDLGWEPINDFLDRQRVSYFARIQGFDSSKLCRIVFEELKSLKLQRGWDYPQYMIYSIGLVWITFITRISTLIYLNSFLEGLSGEGNIKINDRSSLDNF